MIARIVFLNFCLIKLFTAVSLQQNGNAKELQKFGGGTKNFIVNGLESPPRIFYARVNLGYSFCGAAIINKRFLATAANCIYSLLFLTR